jgi:hypothetical protein
MLNKSQKTGNKSFRYDRYVFNNSLIFKIFFLIIKRQVFIRLKFLHMSIKPLVVSYLKVCHSSTVFDANPRAELLRKRHTKRRINGDALWRFIQTHSKIFD